MIRWSLILGGIFNLLMGLVFFSNSLLAAFFRAATRAEALLFSQTVVVAFPTDPLHQLLIHGFGASVMILGAVLIWSASDPERFLPFIFVDGLGRLFFGMLMLVYVFRFHLLRTIIFFAMLELTFAVLYLLISRYLSHGGIHTKI
jgi:hypothetical protein